jgi:predicted RNase H-like nuclease (RuvC/YqgF family)
MERESEYIKDRLNQEIRGLLRENSMLKNSLLNRDREIVDLQEKLRDADSTVNFLSVCLGTVLIVLIVGTLAAIRMFNA